MRKTVFMLAVVLGVLTACEKVEVADEGEVVQSSLAKAFTFHVKGDFTTSFEEMTRAAVRLENENAAGVTDVWVLDYVDGVLKQQAHQTSTQSAITFGSVPMNLTYGHHDIKFVASKGTDAVLTESALTWGRVKDTFVLDYPVDVVASSNGNRAPELARAISGLKVVISDAIPQDAKTVVLTLGKRSQSLTLPGLSALPYSESSAEVDCSSNRGVKGAAVAIYTLAGDEEWTSTASISVKKEDGTVITSFDLPEVTLKRNRMTTLTGEVFNRTSGFSISVDNTWDADLTGTF